MRLPKHVNPKGRAALAPYNFVPLPETIISIDPEGLPDQGVYDENRQTGEIECVLTTESPVYIRCPLTPEQFEHQEQAKDEKAPWREKIRNSPDFFYTDYTDPAKTPRIPGSSLRGMLRSLVEIGGYGKMEFVSGRRLVYRAVGDTSSHGATYRNRIMHDDGEGYNAEGKRCHQYTPKVRAGYMEQCGGDWYIRPAQQVGGTSFARIRIDNIPRGLKEVPGCKNASYFYIQPGLFEYADVRGGFLRIRKAKVVRYSPEPGTGLLEGRLARSGYMASKRTEAVVFPPDESDDLIPIKDELVRDYREQISDEQRDLLGKNGVLNPGQPVFYLVEDGQLVFFGHTMMMRLPYRKSLLDLIPAGLRKPEQVDLAEAIFGYTKSTGEARARSYAGRIFVGDAVLEPNQTDVWLLSDGVLTPKILGSPKPTTFQHYLVQQRPDAEEIGRTKDGFPKYQKQLADYETETVLRGHKLYWHQGSVKAGDIQEELEKLKDKKDPTREKLDDTQHTQMKPVKAGVRFRFIVRFENLSEEELGALLWALTLPGEPGTQHRHSIGMGKPYGMGAVKLDPVLRLESRRERYLSLLDDDSRWHTGLRDVDADETARLVQSFDKFVRNRIGASSLPALAAVERIQMLLKLLEWPGPDHELTRYLEIERQDPDVKRGKINEYKDRPVLPDPLAAIAIRPAGSQLGGPARSSGPATPPARLASEKTPAAQQPRPGIRPGQQPDTPPRPSAQQPVAKVTTELSYPATPAEVIPGMFLEGKVKRVEPGRIVVDICGEEATLSREAISPPIRDTYDERERFPTGKLICAWVKRRNKAGRIQLTMMR